MKICGAQIEKIIDCKFYIISPSITIQYRNQTFETPISTSGVFNPRWYHTIDFRVNSLEDQIIFKIIQNDYKFQNIIGQRTLKVKDLLSLDSG